MSYLNDTSWSINPDGSMEYHIDDVTAQVYWDTDDEGWVFRVTSDDGRLDESSGCDSIEDGKARCSYVCQRYFRRLGATR